MKLCITHIRHKYTGGVERYLNYLSAFLAERGHDVTIACRSHEAAHHPAVRFARLHNFAIGKGWRMWAFDRAVREHLQRARYDVVYALGRTTCQDVIRMGGGCHATFLEQMRQVEVSAGVNAHPRWRLRDRATLDLEARGLAPGAYRRVITNSHMVSRDIMRRYGVPQAAITVIHNGTDTELFHPCHRQAAGAELRRSLGFTGDERVFLFLATGYKRKGLDLLLEAFTRAAAGDPRLRLMVVGQDSAQSGYEASAARLGIADRLRFLGSRKDPQHCYAAADVYVLPTRYDPFANSTVEALASGMPVITSDSNGGSELIGQGVQGTVLSLERDGIAGLAAALQAWSDEGRLRAGAAAARQLAEQHTIRSKLEQTEQLLLEVAARKARG